MPNDGYELDAPALSRVSKDLVRDGQILFDAAPALQVSPDAGRSSNETAQALAALSNAIAGLGGHVGDMATKLDESIAGYRTSDEDAAHRLGGLR